MTTLIKNISYTAIPATPGFPGFPGRPAIPARDVWESYQVCTMQPPTVINGRTLFNALTSAAGRSYQVLPMTATDMGTAGRVTSFVGTKFVYSDGSVQFFPDTNYYTYALQNGSYQKVCQTYWHWVHYPGIPGTPSTPPTPGTAAQLIAEYNLGWTGRATSVDRLDGQGWFGFSIPSSSQGVVVGVTHAPSPTGFGDIFFGVYAANGLFKVVENGITVSSAFSYIDGDVFKIFRDVRGGEIFLYRGATLMWSSTDTSGSEYLSAAIYTGGDYVYDAYIAPGGYQDNAPMPSATSVAGETGVLYAIGDGVMPRITSVAGVFSMTAADGAQVMSGLEGIGGVAYAQASGTMHLITGYGEGMGDMTPHFIIGRGMMMAMNGGGGGMTGEIGSQLDGAMSVLWGLAADHAMGQQTGGAMPAIYGLAGGGDSVFEASVISVGVSTNPYLTAIDLYVVFNSTGTAATILTTQVLNDASVASTATVGDTYTLSQIIEAVMLALARAGSLTFENPDVQVWAMNTKNNGTTRYTGYNFNSFAKIGSKHYATRADGVYKLSGANDSGAAIAASVNFGKMDFGTSRLKSITQCYVGVASTGAIVLKVVADGLTYYYTARDNSAMLGTQRVDLGRGFRTNFIELELQNTAGGAFEFATVEFTPIPLSRRI